MFFLTLFIGFLLIGSIITMIDTFFPGFFLPVVLVFMRWTGVILIWCGALVYIGRMSSTGGNKLGDLPNPQRAKLIHTGKSSARILNAKKEEPNRLRTLGTGKYAYMNIKDMGEPINIAGHDVFITSQDSGHTIPLWICDLIDKWKQKTGARNEEEFLKMYDEIKNIKSYTDLEKKDTELGKLFSPVMKDPERRKLIFDMKIENLREMKELLYDGRTVNAKTYLDWAEEATPYDNETIIQSTLSHRYAQEASYLRGTAGDWAKVVIPAMIILILGAIAYQIFRGA